MDSSVGHCQTSRLRSSIRVTLPNSRRAVSLRLFSRHAVVHQLGDLFVEVLADRRGKLIVTATAREELSEPSHKVSYTPARARTRVIPANIFSTLEISCSRCFLPAAVNL